MTCRLRAAVIVALFIGIPALAIPRGPQNAADGGELGANGNLPDASANPIRVDLAVDWSQQTDPITKLHWGVADYSILKPSHAGQPQFNDYLRKMDPALIRIHHAGLQDTWTDATERRWDVEKIKRAFADARGYGDTPIMLNIPSWPKWLHDGPTLPEEKEAEFVALVGDLVRVMRDEVRRPVAYWEPLNEKDNSYEKAGRLEDLWALWKKLAAEIRRQDPDARVGGMAFTWSKPQWVRSFMAAAGEEVDFLSWHNYATGKVEESNASIFDKVESNVGTNAKSVIDLLANHPRRDRIETFLNEYNISWTWETRDPRMSNNIGAIFDALVVKKIAETGLTGGTVWHVQDNVYGLLKSDGQWRTPAYLYVWGPEYLVGKMAKVSTGDSTALEALAVRRADGGRSLLLITEAGRTVVAPSVALLLPGAELSNLKAHRLDAGGMSELDLSKLNTDEPLHLPGYSLTLLIESADASRVE